MRVLALDPGNVYTGWCIIDSDTYKPIEFGKTENRELEAMIVEELSFNEAVIEMVRSYGMNVGATIFETCVQIGRFEHLLDSEPRTYHERVYRKEYITALTGNPKAKDSNVIAYLIERFAPDTPNRGKGTKANQGWFYGFAADIWQSYAIAVYYCDKLNKKVW